MITWDDDTVDLVKKLWAEGHSALQISLQIPGATRSAICGKLNRLGMIGTVKRANILGRKNGPVKVKKDKKEPAVIRCVIEPKPIEPEPIPEPIIMPDNCEPVEYLKLEHHHCRALLDERGSDGLLLSCGRPRLTENGVYASSYCPTHDERYINELHKGGRR